MMALAREAIGGKEAEKIFLLATNVNSGQKESAFCPTNGAVASCGMSSEFRDWTNGQGGLTWSDRQVSWYFRDPDDACQWTFHCKYSLNDANQQVVNSTMHQLLAKSARCPPDDSNAGMGVVGMFGALAVSLALSCILVIF